MALRMVRSLAAYGAPRLLEKGRQDGWLVPPPLPLGESLAADGAPRLLGAGQQARTARASAPTSREKSPAEGRSGFDVAAPLDALLVAS